MKLSEEQKIAAKLGEFDPISEVILKDEQEKIAAILEKDIKVASDADPKSSRSFFLGRNSNKSLQSKEAEGYGEEYDDKKKHKEKSEKDESDSEESEDKEASTKEAQPPMGAPPMAAGGGAPQMMPGQMAQMGGGMPGMGGDPQAAAAAAMQEAAEAESDPIEHENETLRKMIENKKLKKELMALDAEVPGGTVAEAAGATGTPEGDPMQYMRQALSE